MITGRRQFLSGVAGAVAGTGQPDYPRVFSGRELAMISFPLGGVAAGSIGLGGRGQLRDWEIFNRPDKGRSPEYAFPAIWVRMAGQPPVARILEARLAPPYEGATGLGSRNVPGLPRLERAVFTGAYPLARIDFEDASVPVQVRLEAFSPFIPLDEEASGLPVAVLRYTVKNTGAAKVEVSVAYSVANPVGTVRKSRTVEHRSSAGVQGLVMANPGAGASEPENGSLALSVLDDGAGRISHLAGWPHGKWWSAPLLFWDDFKLDGELGPLTGAPGSPVGSLALKRELAAGVEADFTLLLAWHFPNRTPDWCGWRAPKGHEHANLGNYYATRFEDAWEATLHTAGRLRDLERRTRVFVSVVRESTLPPAVKDAAASNLSTLATPTCFRTADGAFWGFEGIDERSGCCYGNCVHVWNYETATAHLFPALSRSMRETAFFTSSDGEGRMHFRQLLPAGIEQFGVAAADGQMGQIVRAYLDWRLSGDNEWLRRMWPALKRGLEFAWIPGGWDADRDGVMEGVQHNTYDVEFFGSNPQCGVWYLAALRAAEEMARAVGEGDAAREYRNLFESGRTWIDEHLFNGEHYIQQVRGVPPEKLANGLMSGRGEDDPEFPEDYQAGEGCLVDQLVGQYFANVAGLGPLLDPAKIRSALGAIYKYNYKRPLVDHECVQRIFALNDEGALVICDYKPGRRPLAPFPYFGEVMTGFEYSAAIAMLCAGMVSEGVECITNIRRRYDGERRNPWDEAECGRHYARAMAAWSAIPALSGFDYGGASKALSLAPRIHRERFASFWSTATGWGKFTQAMNQAGIRIALRVEEGSLRLRSATLSSGNGRSSARMGAKEIAHHSARAGAGLVFRFAEELELKAGETLTLVAGPSANAARR